VARRLAFFLGVALLGAALWWRPALAETGVLVVQVSDVHRHPVAGLVLSTQGDGSTRMQLRMR
jgi:hypothetical protein